MIYITPASKSANAAKITINNSHFINNKNIHLIEAKGVSEIVLWQLSTYFYFYRINVSLNEHPDGSNLIPITNSVLYMYENSTFMSNTYYESILMLHLSTVVYSGYSVFGHNCVKHIMKITRRSYFIMTVGSVLVVSNNSVYSIAKQVHVYEDSIQPVCPIHFYNPKHFYDNQPNEIKVQVLMLYNIHTVSKGLIGSDLTFDNCTWLAGSAFRLTNAEVVYKMVFQIKI